MDSSPTFCSYAVKENARYAAAAKSSISRIYLPPSERQKSTDVSHILHSLQDGNKMQQVIICRVVDPPFYWYGII